MRCCSNEVLQVNKVYWHYMYILPLLSSSLALSVLPDFFLVLRFLHPFSSVCTSLWSANAVGLLWKKGRGRRSRKEIMVHYSPCGVWIIRLHQTFKAFTKQNAIETMPPAVWKHHYRKAHYHYTASLTSTSIMTIIQWYPNSGRQTYETGDICLQNDTCPSGKTCRHQRLV